MYAQAQKQDSLPFRVGKQEVAKILGFKSHDIPILIRSKHLKPLGNPSLNAPKSFSTTEVIEYGSDREWMDKAMRIIQNHWKANHKNRKAE